MAIVAKSELAEILRVSRARISQFLKMGLPQRADGQVDLDAALHWVRSNVEPDADGGGASVVASDLLRERAATPARSGARRRRDDDENPVDMAMNAAVGGMFIIMPGVAAAAAREAGCDDAIVEKVWQIAYDKAMRQGNAVMEQMLGLDPRGDYWPSLESCRGFTVGDAD